MTRWWGVALAALVLTACGRGGGKAASTTTVSSTSTTGTTLAVGRDAPTAGVCADVPSGTVLVTVTLGPDLVPEPRCTKAHGDQHLKVVDNTGEVLVVDFAGLSEIVLPGRSLTAALTFGKVWGPGVHDLGGRFQKSGDTVSLGEIWIVPGSST